jgi:tetratricopeptide (TPR) repeat protein
MIKGKNEDGTIIYKDDGSLMNRWIEDLLYNPESCVTYHAELSFIDLLKELHTTVPHPLLNVTYDQVVGEKSNIFISFAYGDDFFELLNSIEQYIINNPHLNKDTTYFWIDMFVNNQWISPAKDFNWWTSTFKNAIGEIGSVLLFISDWYKGPLLRAWCIFEVYCTAINQECEFEVIMSESDQTNFFNNILNDPSVEINKMLSIIKSKKSTCWVDDDRIKIHSIIEEIIGFNGIDTMIFEQLRTWVIQTTLFQYKIETNEIKKLDIMHCLAILYSNQGKYDKAEPLYLECLDKRKMLLGDDHVNTLHSMNNLGNLYDDKGNYDKAEKLYLECLDKRKILLGDDHVDTLGSMNNIAILYKNQKKYDKAEPLYLECLNKYEVLLGDDHVNTLRSLNNLAVLYKNQRKYDKAEPLFVECLNKYKIKLGGDDVNTLRSMNNLAILYKNQGKYDKAEPLFVECLDKRKMLLGGDHNDTLISLNNLAGLYVNQRNYDKAEPLFVECLDKRKVLLGDDHNDTLISLNNLADLYDNQRKYDKAEPLFVECLVTEKKFETKEISKKCKFWPNRCSYGIKCHQFVKYGNEAHPEVNNCINWPTNKNTGLKCKFGDKCVFFHKKWKSVGSKKGEDRKLRKGYSEYFNNRNVFTFNDLDKALEEEALQTTTVKKQVPIKFVKDLEIYQPDIFYFNPDVGDQNVSTYFTGSNDKHLLKFNSKVLDNLNFILLGSTNSITAIYDPSCVLDAYIFAKNHFNSLVNDEFVNNLGFIFSLHVGNWRSNNYEHYHITFDEEILKNSIRVHHNNNPKGFDSTLNSNMLDLESSWLMYLQKFACAPIELMSTLDNAIKFSFEQTDENSGKYYIRNSVDFMSFDLVNSGNGRASVFWFPFHGESNQQWIVTLADSPLDICKSLIPEVHYVLVKFTPDLLPVLTLATEKATAQSSTDAFIHVVSDIICKIHRNSWKLSSHPNNEGKMSLDNCNNTPSIDQGSAKWFLISSSMLSFINDTSALIVVQNYYNNKSYCTLNSSSIPINFPQNKYFNQDFKKLENIIKQSSDHKFKEFDHFLTTEHRFLPIVSFKYGPMCQGNANTSRTFIEKVKLLIPIMLNFILEYKIDGHLVLPCEESSFLIPSIINVFDSDWDKETIGYIIMDPTQYVELYRGDVNEWIMRYHKFGNRKIFS